MMHSNYFIQKLGFEFDIQSIPNDLLILAGSIGIDAIHCSGEYPAVFFKEVSDFNIHNLEEIAEIQRKIWNNSSVVFLYVVSPVEIRIYNCNAKPVYFDIENSNSEIELKENEIDICLKTDTKKLLVLNQVFSAIAIDSGKIWTSEYSQKIKLHTKVDRYLVESLLKLAKKLGEDLKDDNIIHSLLMRSIFVMYLQDRKAIPLEILDQLGEKDFLKILDNHTKTYQLFVEIESHFNGNVFPVSILERQTVNEKHLNLLKQCLIDGYIDESQPKLFKWRLFDFSFIRIELLSEIYENFLNAFDPIRKKQTGTFYTPPSLVELVLDNVLPKNGNNYNLKIIDLASGSGIFLAQAYKRIVKYWQKKHSDEELSFKVLTKIMQNSIFGVEIDPNSIKVAAFSLYLALLDFLDPRDVWLKNGNVFPYLIRDLESKNEIDKKGNNLFRTDTISENGEFEEIKFDIVVGNPPFGTKDLPENVKKYCEKNLFDNQYVIPFIHKSTKLAKNGKIALLFNTHLLTYPKKGIENFRYWLFNKNYVEKVYNISIFRNASKNFGGSLFSGAKVPVSIIVFKPQIPKVTSKTIEYWAPRTFIKNNVVEGVLIEKSDIKYLPRELCQKADSNIWKIAQWGNISDFILINELRQSNPTLENLENNEEIYIKAGLHAKEENKETYRVKGQFLDIRKIRHYYTHKSFIDEIDSDFRKFEEDLFVPPYIGLSQNIMERKICASFFDKKVFFKSGMFLIKTKNIEQLKNYTILLNSKLANYYFFLISGCWGIERDQLFLTSEYKTFPVSINFINNKNTIDFSDTGFDNKILNRGSVRS